MKSVKRVLTCSEGVVRKSSLRKQGQGSKRCEKFMR